MTSIQDARERRRIEVINVYNTLAILIASIYFIAFSIKCEYIFSLFALFTIIIAFAVVSFLQYKGKYVIARLILNINSGASVVLFSYLHGWTAGFPIYFTVSPLLIITFQDIRKRSDTYRLTVFYLCMILSAYLLHIFGYEYTSKYAEIMFVVNLISSLVLNTVLAYYLWKIYDDYGKQAESKNTKLILKNEELVNINHKVADLVGLLHDKVKNNLQTLLLFTEMDKIANIEIGGEDYIRLSRSRVKVMDICYRIEFEHSLPQSAWCKHFLEDYADNLQVIYKNKFKPEMVISLDIADSGVLKLSRKHFDAIMLLINELFFHVFCPVSDHFVSNMVIKAHRTDDNQYFIGFSIKKYPFELRLNPIFNRLVRTQRVNLNYSYNEETEELSLSLVFDIEPPKPRE